MDYIYSHVPSTVKLGLKTEPDDTQPEIDAKRQENEKIERENQTALQTRRSRIAQAFLPFLQQRLIRQFIIQTMTGVYGCTVGPGG